MAQREIIRLEEHSGETSPNIDLLTVITELHKCIDKNFVKPEHMEALISAVETFLIHLLKKLPFTHKEQLLIKKFKSEILSRIEVNQYVKGVFRKDINAILSGEKITDIIKQRELQRRLKVSAELLEYYFRMEASRYSTRTNEKMKPALNELFITMKRLLPHVDQK